VGPVALRAETEAVHQKQSPARIKAGVSAQNTRDGRSAPAAALRRRDQRKSASVARTATAAARAMVQMASVAVAGEVASIGAAAS